MLNARTPARIRRLGVSLVATLAAVVAGLSLTASPAAAKPVRLYSEPAAVAAAANISCNQSVGDSSYGIACYFPGPTTTVYRPVITCNNGAVRYGPWKTVNSGVWSYAYCPTNAFVVDRYIQLG